MKQSSINQKFTAVKKDILETRRHVCANCGGSAFLTPSHTIAQKDCKYYGVYELIWDERNIEILCVTCHQNWECGRKSNISPRLLEYVKGISEKIKTPELYQRYKYKFDRNEMDKKYE